jgi:hypothetical protein
MMARNRGAFKIDNPWPKIGWGPGGMRVVAKQLTADEMHAVAVFCGARTGVSSGGGRPWGRWVSFAKDGSS